MSGGQFRIMHPPQPTQIKTGTFEELFNGKGEVVDEIPAVEMIVCDLCNNEIDLLDTCYLLYKGARLYCVACAGISVLPNIIYPQGE